MSLKKIYVGAIVNRDCEVFEEIKKFSKINHNIKIVELFKKNKFSVKYFRKKLKKYPISYIIVKLYSEPSNQKIYDALKEYAPHIPRLNSVKAVRTGESRKATFKIIKDKCKKLRIPDSYFTVDSAYEACKNGQKIIIKFDIHSARDLPKEDRIIGIARSPEEFHQLIEGYNESDLFFQHYLGKIDLVYKVYVIDKWVVCITSANRVRRHKLSPLELIHIRVPVDPGLKRKILRLGRKFGMSIFGVDYVVKDGKYYVVDVNDFPSFRNIPEAISFISDYIYNFLDARENMTEKIPMRIKSKTFMS